MGYTWSGIYTELDTHGGSGIHGVGHIKWDTYGPGYTRSGTQPWMGTHSEWDTLGVENMGSGVHIIGMQTECDTRNGINKELDGYGVLCVALGFA